MAASAPRSTDTAIKAVSALSRILAMIGGLAIVSIVVLTVIEVFSRRLTGRSIGPVDEVSAYLFAAGTSLSLAWALVNRAHIRIDILYARMTRPLRVAFDLLALLSLTVCAGALLWHGWQVFATSWRAGSRSASTLGVPLVLPQGAWLFGIAIFTGVLLTFCAVAIRALLASSADPIVEHMSPPNVDEITVSETRHAAGKPQD
jgi:TRAP-type C4-dicarboxylate transport system permease small subunit